MSNATHPPDDPGRRGPLWTIAELGERVAQALSVGYRGQSNGQVSDIPNRRTIRYYTTLGLIDRAAAMRGRVALYGRRHLMQLVAIKRLQLRGQKLTTIQGHLATVTDSELLDLAQLPHEDESGSGAEASVDATPATPEPEFWRVKPAPLSPAETPGESNTSPLRASATPVGVFQGIRLAAEVTLLLESGRSLDADELESIGAAAETLLQVLRKRGLIRSSPGDAS